MQLDYKLSLYAKEELPTWSEIYNLFHKDRIYFYNPEKDTKLDPYWGIPERLVLLAVCTNQLNKMIWEDNKIADIREEFRIDDGIRFYLTNSNNVDAIDIPPIYTIPFPSGKRNPFITNHHPRVDIKKEMVDEPVWISMAIQDGSGVPIYPHAESITIKVIDYIIEPIVDYFSEEHTNGNSVPMFGSGYDPFK